MAEPIEAITRLNDALDGVPFSYAFLGGSVLSLLVTDKSVDAIRVMGLGTVPLPPLREKVRNPLSPESEP